MMKETQIYSEEDSAVDRRKGALLAIFIREFYYSIRLDCPLGLETVLDLGNVSIWDYEEIKGELNLNDNEFVRHIESLIEDKGLVIPPKESEYDQNPPF